MRILLDVQILGRVTATVRPQYYSGTVLVPLVSSGRMSRTIGVGWEDPTPASPFVQQCRFLYLLSL